MTKKSIRPGLTAATAAGRALLAAGWTYDSTSPMAGGSTSRVMLHPSGREIEATTSKDGDSTTLTMTGLTLEQAAGAVTGAGLTAPAPEPTGERAALVAGLRALADFYDAHPDLPLPSNEISHCVLADDDATGQAEIARAAEMLGVDVISDNEGTEASRTFGGVCLRFFYVGRQAAADWSALTSYNGAVLADAEPAGE